MFTQQGIIAVAVGGVLFYVASAWMAGGYIKEALAQIPAAGNEWRRRRHYQGRHWKQ